MSIYDLEPIDLSRIHTYELTSRPSKVTVSEFSTPLDETDTVRDLLNKLPNVLAVESLRGLARQMKRARTLGKPIIWGLGGHVIKTG